MGPIEWNLPRPNLVEQFRQTLDAATDERPLQRFFEANPVALLTGLVRPHAGWVIPRARLFKPDGTGWVPDFIVCEWSSIGPLWLIVELESPRRSPVTKKGVSAVCNHAVEQINSYRTYLRDNAVSLRANGWPEIHGECEGVVVIGRRSDPGRQRQRERLEAFRREKVEIMSYDRLLEACQEMQQVISALRRDLMDTLKRPSANSHD